jgi:hypothetical protein
MSQRKNLARTSGKRSLEIRALKEESELIKNRVKMWKEKKVTFATPQEEQASEPSSESDDATDKYSLLPSLVSRL